MTRREPKWLHLSARNSSRFSELRHAIRVDAVAASPPVPCTATPLLNRAALVLSPAWRPVPLHAREHGGRAIACLGYDLFGESLRQPAMRAASETMRDHRRIKWERNPWKRFRPQEARMLHLRSRAYVEAELAKPYDGPTVVRITRRSSRPSSRNCAAAWSRPPTRPTWDRRSIVINPTIGFPGTRTFPWTCAAVAPA
ncbi:hypothetical protein SAMN05443247_11489 [Bradyrhizobium erythrophlei]|nr:hypothetical protein SAMN05443247_11489 [Bradyrhizobium erythrophlei]